MKTRPVERDTRDYDTTQLHEAQHGKSLHRDYSAHFFRWSFARRFIGPKDDVLEVGCGEDRPLSKILTGGAAAHVNTYVGVDLNKLKESGSQRLTFIGEFNFVERWRELLKLRPKGFSVVVHFEVVEHMRVDHGAKFLKSCNAVLKLGGTMLMSTPCYDGRRHAANHIHEYTVPELRKVAERAGFKVVRRFGTFMDIKHIEKGHGLEGNMAVYVRAVYEPLSAYFDNDALSCFFAPLFPDHARNNLWVCKKEKSL